MILSVFPVGDIQLRWCCVWPLFHTCGETSFTELTCRNKAMILWIFNTCQHKNKLSMCQRKIVLSFWWHMDPWMSDILTMLYSLLDNTAPLRNFSVGKQVLCSPVWAWALCFVSCSTNHNLSPVHDSLFLKDFRVSKTQYCRVCYTTWRRKKYTVESNEP